MRDVLMFSSSWLRPGMDSIVSSMLRKMSSPDAGGLSAGPVRRQIRDTHGS